MAQKLYSPDDAMSKLNGSICLYKGNPYRVCVDGSIIHDKVHLHNLKDSSVFGTVKYTEDSFDYSACPLGWFTYEDQSHYLTRVPNRTSTLGLTRNNLNKSLTSNQFYSEAMFKCIKGDHPSFDEAFEKLWTEPNKVVPFNRDACLTRVDPYNATIKFYTKQIAYINRACKVTPLMSSHDGMISKVFIKLGIDRYV